MSDIFVVGTETKLLIPDALSAWGEGGESVGDGSEEPEGVCELLSDLTYSPQFSGDNVYRRMYLMIEWDNGVELAITPWVNGVELVGFKKTFIRTGAGRESVGLAMVKRGSWIAAHILSGVPTGRFAIEIAAEVGFQPGLNTKQLDT